MIKKYSLVLIAILCSFFYGFGQITTIDFETSGAGYTSSGTENTGVAFTDVFNRTNPNIGGNSTFIWSVEDINLINPSIDLDQIDITGSSEFTFAIDMIAHHYIDWDDNDELLITYSIDSGTYQNLMWIQNAGATFNQAASLDSDFDGNGNCGTGILPALTIGNSGCNVTLSTFSTFTTAAISLSSNTTLDIKLQFNGLTATDEGIYLDNIIITETIPCTDAVDFANIQWPNSSPQDITVGGNFDVFAQVLEAGVTEAAGQGSNIEAWIGYNTTNDNPSNASWTWIAATYNTDSGNNDEYTAEIGSGLTTGTYYYASRFRLNGCGFTYGGTGGIWSSNSVQLNVNEDTLDFYNLQFPEIGSINIGGIFDVFGQVYEAGVTPGAGQGTGISAWVGYSTSNTDPSTWVNWVAAGYNPICADCNLDQNDEYFVDIGSVIPSAGTYYYATRFKLNSGPFTYGGILADGTAGSEWDGSTYISGVLTVIDPNPPICNFSDDFNRADNSTVGGGWTETGGDASILSNELSIITGGTTGIDYVYQDVSASYTTQLSASTDIVTWEFNLRQIRTDPSGFGNNNYGVGFILGGTSSDITTGNGYAVVLGQSGATDNIRLVNYSGGISNSTNIITGSSDFGNDYLSIRVVFDPSSSTWELFVRDDGTAFTSPSTLDVIDSEGTAINSTFTNSNLDFVAALWNHATGATETASFDNICISIETVCTPTHSITSFSPTSGPENTEVTIIGTGFTASTTATFNGATATIVSQTSTELVITVPSGASTGVITVNESSCDIETNTDFIIVDSVNNGCQGTVSTTELFISEITDATSGSLSYIEIYNGTGATVNLSEYTIEIRYNSGNTKVDFTMSGNLIDGGIHVVSTNVDTPCSVTGGNGSLNDEASTMSGVNTPKNGADCISLFKNYINASSPGTLIDVWGDCSKKNWRENLGVAIGNEGFNFKRLASASPIPNTTFTIADWNIIDWEDDACTDDDYSDIGSYTPGLTPIITLNPNASSSCELTAELTVAGSEGFNDSGDTQELTYQWYYSAPGDSGWTVITDGVLYTGATTTILSVSNVLNTIDYQFYCKIREDDVTCYQATNATRLDVERTTWDGSSWDNGDPDIDTIVIIDGNFDTRLGSPQTSFEACNLIVNAGYELNVRDITYVKVQNNVAVDGAIVVQTKGAFVQVDDAGTFTLNAGGTGSVIKETAIIEKWYEYTYWSSPVLGETVEDAFPDTPSNRRFWFNAQNYLDQTKEVGNDNNNTNPGQDDIDDNGDDWQIASGVMTKGLGYAATTSPLGMFPRTDQATFIGEFHTGDIYVSVYKNDAELADNNWNLIGNPYPSAISADDFLAANSVVNQNVPINPPIGAVSDGAIFLWSQDSSPSNSNNGNENENFAQSDYAIINSSTQVAGGDGEIPSRYIPSGQSFFTAYDDTAAGTLVSGTIYEGIIKFTNSMRMADTSSNNQFFRRVSETDNKLWLNLTSDNGVFSQIAMAYVEEASHKDDGSAYDTERISSLPRAASIYSKINGKKEKGFAIQSKSPSNLTVNEVINLGFKTEIDIPTLYKFSIPKLEGSFFETNNIYVKDRQLNRVHNLLDSDYAFTSETGEFNKRFKIVFKSKSKSFEKKAENLNTINSLKIIEHYNGNIEFALNSAFNLKKITILDFQGKLIYTLNADGYSKVFNLSNLKQATYIAQVELTDGSIITKKLIKRK